MRDLFFFSGNKIRGNEDIFVEQLNAVVSVPFGGKPVRLGKQAHRGSDQRSETLATNGKTILIT
jgi:hypothetical protein